MLENPESVRLQDINLIHSQVCSKTFPSLVTGTNQISAVDVLEGLPSSSQTPINSSHGDERTQCCGKSEWSLFRNSCLESQDRGWSHCYFFSFETREASGNRFLTIRLKSFGMRNTQLPSCLLNAVNVYGGFPAVATLTAGVQLFPCASVCSIRRFCL